MLHTPARVFLHFFLLYGREVRGPLQMIFEDWAGDRPSDGEDISDYIHGVCSRLWAFLGEVSGNQAENAMKRKRHI